MILHYLKIAWRNLLKYRIQTAVNVVGIAVGFACFAFANLWMRYEASFDSRYEAADRMYLIYTESAIESGGEAGVSRGGGGLCLHPLYES